MADGTLYTPDIAGSGQRGICIHCRLRPTPEGHDGCLGSLDEAVVMNACCGHGKDAQAYVQFWDGSAVRGSEAKVLIQSLKPKRS